MALKRLMNLLMVTLMQSQEFLEPVDTKVHIVENTTTETLMWQPVEFLTQNYHNKSSHAMKSLRL